MKKALYTIIICLLPFIVNAKTITYDICKKDCEYNSILLVWYDINHLTEDAEIIINFKDQATYTFMDWDNMWVLEDFEESSAHIYNEHVKKITINGNKDSNTTIDVINIDNDTIREIFASGNTKYFYKANVYDFINDRKIFEKNQLSFPEIISYGKMIDLLNNDIIEFIENNNLTNNYDVYMYMKNNKTKLVEDLPLDYWNKYTYYDEYDENINYLSKLLLYQTSIGNIINDDNTCSYAIQNSSNQYVIRNISQNECDKIIDSYVFFNNYVKSIINPKQEDFNTILSTYNNDTFINIVSEEKQKILLGENEMIEKMLDFLNTGEFDYDSILSSDFVMNYPYIRAIMKGLIDIGIVDELSDSDIELIRLMFTGIFNTDFEINNINFHGSPAFATGTGHINGVINNSSMPFLLLVGGDVELHIHNSVVNRIYALGTDAIEEDYKYAEYCNGINMCGNAKIYLDETDTILKPYRRIDINSIINLDEEIKRNIMESVIQGDPKYDKEESNESNFNALKETKPENNIIDYYGNTCYWDRFVFCYSDTENKYYRYDFFYEYNDEFREGEAFKNTIYLFDTVEQYLHNSVLVELEGGKIYFTQNKAIKLNVNNQKDLKEVFSFSDTGIEAIEWQIEDSTIAQIKDGKIIALKKGKTKIIANYAGTIYELILEVEDPIKNPETTSKKNLFIITALISIILLYNILMLKRVKKKYL